jgi:hypothetical protein
MEDEVVRRFGWWITCQAEGCPTENAKLYYVTNNEDRPLIVCGPCQIEYSDITFEEELT